MTPLGDKINEVMTLALQSPDGYAIWRGTVLGETWKISVTYDGWEDKFTILAKRRDAITDPRE